MDSGNTISIHYFDITEDMNIDEYTTENPPVEDVTPLLYLPLPADLPTVGFTHSDDRLLR